MAITHFIPNDHKTFTNLKIYPNWDFWFENILSGNPDHDRFIGKKCVSVFFTAIHRTIGYKIGRTFLDKASVDCSNCGLQNEQASHLIHYLMLPPEKKPFDRFFTFCFYIP
jgi:hypothetical protein